MRRRYRSILPPLLNISAARARVFLVMDTKNRAKIDLRSGDTVKVYQKIKEKGKIRLQLFEGMVIARKHGVEAGATFTVRKVSSGVGVEKIFPLYSPNIDKIEVVKRSKSRRSKLYHIRDKAARETRKRMRVLSTSITQDLGEAEAEPVVEEVAEVVAEEAVTE